MLQHFFANAALLITSDTLLKNQIYFWFVLITSISTISCKNNQGNKVDEDYTGSVNETIPVDVQPVKYVILKNAMFLDELLANGKVTTKRKADLKFRTEGILKDVMVMEGDRVQTGQTIALLDNKTELFNISSAELQYQQALLDYQDQLLRAGYRIPDSNKIDAKVKEIARLRSGLSRSEIELQQAKSNFEQTRLSAPFAGKIANVKAKPQNSSSAYEFICTIIDDNSFEVNFQVLEQELRFLRQASAIIIIPFSNESTTLTGRIVSINPLIDEDGMVNIKAAIIGHADLLLDGMSVRIKIRQQRDNQLVVPKDAVLDRQGRKVVFTLADSLAKWNYVEIAGENSSSFAISSGLSAGDKVIYEGNFNLANDKLVKVSE